MCLFNKVGVKLLLCAYYYYYYFIYLNSLLLLLETLRKPITITSQTITITVTSQTVTITITFPLLLHLLLLLNHKNTTQANCIVIFKDLYYFNCTTHNHRHITIDNIIIKLSWKIVG